MEQKKFLFGQYFINSDIKEPIEWIVIEETDDTITLISKQVLFFMPFNQEYQKNWSWYNSSLRNYLNTEFCKEAFNDDELDKILPDENMDKVHLISIKSARELLTDEWLLATATSYAKSKVFLYSNTAKGDSWWLCNRGYSSSDTAVVNYNGYIYTDGRFTTNKEGVRPVIILKK